MMPPTIEDLAADLARRILARGDVRVHPSQAAVRRQLRAAMESQARPVVRAAGFRFSLGNGPIWGFEGLPLCVRVEDVKMWQAAAAERKKARRKRR